MGLENLSESEACWWYDDEVQCRASGYCVEVTSGTRRHKYLLDKYFPDGKPKTDEPGYFEKEGWHYFPMSFRINKEGRIQIWPGSPLHWAMVTTPLSERRKSFKK